MIVSLKILEKILLTFCSPDSSKFGIIASMTFEESLSKILQMLKNIKKKELELYRCLKKILLLFFPKDIRSFFLFFHKFFKIFKTCTPSTPANFLKKHFIIVSLKILKKYSKFGIIAFMTFEEYLSKILQVLKNIKKKN